jgi:hypothetical protein
MAALNMFDLRFLYWIGEAFPGARRQTPASLIQRGFVEVEEGEPFLTPAGCAAVIGWRSKGMERFVVEIE